MPTISVSPSQKSYENTGGLCGMWNGNNNSDSELYTLDQNGYESYLKDLTDISLVENFWK